MKWLCMNIMFYINVRVHIVLYCIELYCIWLFIKRFSQQKPFRSAPSASNPEGKGRILVLKMTRRDYQKGWRSGLVEEVHSTEKGLCRRRIWIEPSQS